MGGKVIMEERIGAKDEFSAWSRRKE